jgi:rare lipoprotein A (peptidoglycan hydrolase)
MRQRRRTGRPGFRPVVAATTLVIVCAATVQMGFLARTPISTTPTGLATVPMGPVRGVTGLAAAVDGSLSEAVRWTFARSRPAGATLSSSGVASRCATAQLTGATASISTLGLTCATGVTAVAHEAWSRLRETEAREARALRADRERVRTRTAERRAEKRAAQKRAQQRAAERRAQKRAAEKRAEKRAAERRERKRLAEQRAARRAAQAARRRARSSGGSGWRNSPIVTWYGPGFYGNRTACGVRYTRRIVGVAHRTLPCGTLVEFKWHGITAVAPVIDRGPFASSQYVFDFSAAMACEVFKPRGVDNACFTRYDVKYRVVGKVALKRYLADQ